ncbi:2Fe-2S iron-sulfur cluster binding domain-containing protein [Sulfurimonas aquatica]|uniref:2Fe-2S iron-sulfur cluster binding domain-containing protein n=1 Tax=Sulfurimonas aquatica TaxID=2672570 RepID=A0A975AZG0_9BACT|nr:2Fe-2S iron-sulfur cluster-binding protein [Sulfurimonas aquatica]QSZ41399.1 2Fe-2S iron-sulfur cluster binding domain-containing protein [Sulfurimonas aquatica]
MSEMINIIVDGKTYEAKEGSLLIDLLIKEGVKVPYFCYHESLGADGNCRMCMVGIKGQKRPQIACDTLIKKEMEVFSNTPEICKVRTDILELELINHPVDCPICDQAGECSLQEFYMDYGLHSTKVTIQEKVKHAKAVDLGANVMLDQERCVLCARCTRFTDKITGTHELGIVGRGDDAKVTTMPGRPLSNPYAMNVVDLCPVGALTSKDFRFAQRVWFLETTPAICQGCAKGCNIHIDHNKQKYKDDVVYRFRPRRNDAVNGFFICDEGRLSYKELQENRQESATRNGEVIDEDKALQNAIQLIENSKDSISIVIDANLYTEEMEAILLFAKTINARVHSPLAIYEDESFGDDMLKSSKRGANYKSIETLQIDTNEPKTSSLIINFNHPQNFNASSNINFLTHKREHSALTLPIAAYSENAGTLTNEDGITQYSQQAVRKNTPMPKILEWLERLKV